MVDGVRTGGVVWREEKRWLTSGVVCLAKTNLADFVDV